MLNFELIGKRFNGLRNKVVYKSPDCKYLGVDRVIFQNVKK